MILIFENIKSPSKKSREFEKTGKVSEDIIKYLKMDLAFYHTTRFKKHTTRCEAHQNQSETICNWKTSEVF